MRSPSVRKWQVVEDPDDGCVYVNGLDYRGNAIMEFVFDDRVRIDGETLKSKVIVNRVENRIVAPAIHLS